MGLEFASDSHAQRRMSAAGAILTASTRMEAAVTWGLLGERPRHRGATRP
jgi:hypothetical protein